MIPVIDLFAGPGGLGEGFSSLTDSSGKGIFQIIMSVEKDEQAYKTLRLRSFVRKILDKIHYLPRDYIQYIIKSDPECLEKLKEKYYKEWESACEEAVHGELKDGDNELLEDARLRLFKKFQDVSSESRQWVLVGGPPCQAYSLVGRARRTNDASLQNDVKQTLYRCYLNFICELHPTVFIMENVKGILSARLHGDKVFNLIRHDMEDAGYELHSLVESVPRGPNDYVVRCEQYGIPQKRHRVILLGIRQDSRHLPDILKKSNVKRTLSDALIGIPGIRSSISKRSARNNNQTWKTYLNEAANDLIELEDDPVIIRTLRQVLSSHPCKLTHKNKIEDIKGPLDEWYRLRLGKSKALANHEARSHMPSDLERYLFCSSYAKVHGVSPKLEDFPEKIYPDHRNVKSTGKDKHFKFNDRFRVQVWHEPSTTITSHIAKDGHYYIHPDPVQCRSLTVREAARLQTFPDDYYFEGSKTSQYTQVGNAVPPLLARQIAEIVANYLRVLAEDD